MGATAVEDGQRLVTHPLLGGGSPLDEEAPGGAPQVLRYVSQNHDDTHTDLRALGLAVDAVDLVAAPVDQGHTVTATSRVPTAGLVEDTADDGCRALDDAGRQPTCWRPWGRAWSSLGVGAVGHHISR